MSYDLTDVVERIKAVNKRNGWTKYQTPRNLTLAIAGEVGELCQLMRWMDEDTLNIDSVRGCVEREVADIFTFLLNLCECLDIDPAQVISDKIDRNDTRTLDGPNFIKGNNESS